LTEEFSYLPKLDAVGAFSRAAIFGRLIEIEQIDFSAATVFIL
jgi:predicted HAD superfamily phosphohydrolase